MKTLALIVAASILLSGCEEKPSAPPAPAAQPAAAVPAEYQTNDAFKPEFAIAIEESTTTPKTYAVTWSAKVNTGGYAFKTESVLVEEHMGSLVARVYVTLESPNPTEMVTQATETITGRYDAGQQKIERVEFSVRRMTRGVKYSGQPLYGVMKTIKYPY